MFCTYNIQQVENQRMGLNDRDFDGATPLHFACGRGHLDVVVWLLERGANPVSGDHLGGTPLHDASQHGHLKVQAYGVQL